MTESDIHKIEAAIGKALPPSYKNILLTYPVELTESIKHVEPMSAVLLPNDADQIISNNLFHDKHIRSTSKIVIGGDGCGNDFFIDNVDEKIYELDHEEVKYFDVEQTKFDFLGSLTLGCENIEQYIATWQKIRQGWAS